MEKIEIPLEERQRRLVETMRLFIDNDFKPSLTMRMGINRTLCKLEHHLIHKFKIPVTGAEKVIEAELYNFVVKYYGLLLEALSKSNFRIVMKQKDYGYMLNPKYQIEVFIYEPC